MRASSFRLGRSRSSSARVQNRRAKADKCRPPAKRPVPVCQPHWLFGSAAQPRCLGEMSQCPFLRHPCGTEKGPGARLISPTISLLRSRQPSSIESSPQERLRSDHMTPEDVGRLATAAAVKTVLLTHIAETIGAPEDLSVLTDGVRKTLEGEIIIGTDLLRKWGTGSFAAASGVVLRAARRRRRAAFEGRPLFPPTCAALQRAATTPTTPYCRGRAHARRFLALIRRNAADRMSAGIEEDRRRKMQADAVKTARLREQRLAKEAAEAEAAGKRRQRPTSKGRLDE
jgi:hypothetical protein